jgi:subtilase family serine protease
LGRTQATLVAIALCAACSGGSRGVTPAATTDVVSPSSAFRVLPGHLSARTKHGSDLGRMDPSFRLEGMTVVLARAGTQSQRDALLAALQNPGSPAYHRWLTPEDYAARFGASEQDVARVTRWLETQGFEVSGPSRPRTSLRFSGSVGQLERAFRTEMHRYQVRGEAHFALAVEPSMPVELADVVAGLRNVHDFHPAPLLRPAPAFISGTSYQLGPADWARIYGVAPLYQLPTPLDGTGQKIAVIGASDIFASDILTFRAMFGLSATTPNITRVPGSGTSSTGDAGYLEEASLDLEWSGAIAKNATLEYVYVGQARNYSADDAAQYAFENALAPVVSFSYADCEADYTDIDAINFSWEGDLAAMLGITFVAAAGDGAAAACDEWADQATHGLNVAMPASVPGALAVGGTMLLALPRNRYFDTSGAALSYIPEMAWNDTGSYDAIVGGTGGASALYAKPFWQVGITPNDGARDVPDVAFAASGDVLPYVAVAEKQTTAFGGTSCAAPSFAGILAIVNQAIGAAQPGLGNAGPVLYALASSPAAASVFHDVTVGGNVIPCLPGSLDCPGSSPYQLGYLAAAGYDQATGLGSIDADALVHAWSTLSPTGTLLVASQGGTVEGSPLTLSAAIASKGSVAMTGDVIFYSAAQGTSGGLLTAAPLGAVTVTPTQSGGAAAATAQLDTYAWPGLTGTSTIVAFYSGDENYLASWSSGATVAASSSLAIAPAFSTLEPGGAVSFTSSGGQAPVSWSIWQDVSSGTIDSVSGQYTAGDVGGGRDIIVARDAYGAQAIATVNVLAPEGGAGTGPSGTPDPDDDAALPVMGATGPGATADAATGEPAAANASTPVLLTGVTGGCTAAGSPGAPASLPATALALALAMLVLFRGRVPCWSRTSSSATRRGPRRAR